MIIPDHVTAIVARHVTDTLPTRSGFSGVFQPVQIVGGCWGPLGGQLVSPDVGCFPGQVQSRTPGTGPAPCCTWSQVRPRTTPGLAQLLFSEVEAL